MGAPLLCGQCSGFTHSLGVLFDLVHGLHPQQRANVRHRPRKAAIYADGAQWPRFFASPKAQRLRTAHQVERGLLSGHCGAVDVFQRGEGIDAAACGGADDGLHNTFYASV